MESASVTALAAAASGALPQAMLEEEKEHGHSLEQTPTYIVAAVVCVFVVVSFAIEKGLHHLGHYLAHTKNKELKHVLEKIKDELMLLGFISITLTFTKDYVSSICLPYDPSHPLQRHPPPSSSSSLSPSDFAMATVAAASAAATAAASSAAATPRSLSGWWRGLRLFVSSVGSAVQRGQKGASVNMGEEDFKCPEGLEPMISEEGLEQLHIFIFILAIVHIFYSCITMLLASLQIQGWKKWEDEARGVDAEGRLPTHRGHSGTSGSSGSSSSSSTQPLLPSQPTVRVRGWGLFVQCVLAQFYDSVQKKDYLMLRSYFLKEHRLSNNWDFHAYLNRTMEHDFLYVVGTEWYLWFAAVLFLLFDVKSWHFLFWTALTPVVLSVMIGTKMQYVMLMLTDGASSGSAEFKPTNDHFWFKWPEMILHVINYILFQNAFQVAILMWHKLVFDTVDEALWPYVSVRIAVSVVVQILCSSFTLPLYCLVTQMGSNFKKAVFTDDMLSKLEKWSIDHKKHKSSWLQNLSRTMAEERGKHSGSGGSHGHGHGSGGAGAPASRALGRGASAGATGDSGLLDSEIDPHQSRLHLLQGRWSAANLKEDTEGVDEGASSSSAAAGEGNGASSVGVAGLGRRLAERISGGTALRPSAPADATGPVLQSAAAVAAAIATSGAGPPTSSASSGGAAAGGGGGAAGSGLAQRTLESLAKLKQQQQQHQQQQQQDGTGEKSLFQL